MRELRVQTAIVAFQVPARCSVTESRVVSVVLAQKQLLDGIVVVVGLDVVLYLLLKQEREDEQSILRMKRLLNRVADIRDTQGSRNA